MLIGGGLCVETFFAATFLGAAFLAVHVRAFFMAFLAGSLRVLGEVASFM